MLANKLRLLCIENKNVERKPSIIYKYLDVMDLCISSFLLQSLKTAFSFIVQKCVGDHVTTIR